LDVAKERGRTQVIARTALDIARTAYDIAKRKGHTQVIALLENAAAIAAQVGPSTYGHSK
jgi:hypothetical protein